ncbi:RluA family pseudouridine synthase [Consotaella aegiceratis]|uniref:RluA family pseudouridine synthase n=1 Tax=Consotaella aegiceratis TaxID=3097961 RepID=UPI002F411385
MEASRFVVEADAAGVRLDRFLAERVGTDLSRSRIQSLIEAGAVTIADAIVRLPRHKVAAGDAVAIVVPEPEDPMPQPEAIPLSVLFEDDALIVIDKPAGMVVHPAPGNWTGTLVNALIAHCGESLSGIGGVRRPGIVHRLDKDTSGVMVVAKSDVAHRGLAEQFAAHGRDGRLERSYQAVVWGIPSPAVGTIDAPLGRSSADRTKRTVSPSGRADARHAVTRYHVLQSLGSDIASLVQCRLETGRTHQIRVHMAHIGHPLVGDDVYGAGFRTKANKLDPASALQLAAFRRQALHAFRLAFVHPVTGQRLAFETKIPFDMQELVIALDSSYLV